MVAEGQGNHCWASPRLLEQTGDGKHSDASQRKE